MDSKAIYMYILGGVVVVGIMIIVALLIYVELPSGNRDVLFILVGTLAAKFSDVVSYFYGSSKGSSDKTTIITKQAESKNDATK